MAFVERKMEENVSAEKAAFDRVLIARDPDRPYSLDLFQSIFTDFIEIHGDRRYADDPAIVCGLARIDEKEVVVIGQQKGRDTNQRRFRNFAMPKPEGYRKALRIMGMAEKFGRPIISFIDTPGAYPGIDAEERGQAEAIAVNLREMARFRVPIVAVVLGEGGSGGALAIGIGDRVIMLENAIYSVISPEGCAAILWKDASKADLAAASLKVTAKELKDLGLVDEIVREEKAWEIKAPENDEEGAQDAFRKIADQLKQTLSKNLAELSALDANQLIAARFRKFRGMGRWA